MTPNNIVNMAKLLGLSLIALTDHNTCGNCAATAAVAKKEGILFLPGMELCTAEEAHVVCLFAKVENALAFERYVRPTLPPVNNRPDVFGKQCLCDENDEIISEEPLLLTTASGVSADDVFSLVKRFGGVAFPAHIDRPSYSIPASLGTLPPLGFSVAEVTKNGDIKALRNAYPVLQTMPLLFDSDAHYLENMQEANAYMELDDPTPEHIIAALSGEYPCRFAQCPEGHCATK